MDYLILIAGLVCAALGGEFFVQGLVGLARWARISAAIIASTLAAFATSSPELSVAISSAVSGEPSIAFGNALGSNIINMALILGIALLIAPFKVDRARMRRDYTVAALLTGLLGALGFDGALSRLDGVLLLSVFAAWLVAVHQEVLRQRKTRMHPEEQVSRLRVSAACAAGLVLLVMSGMLIVNGAHGIASQHHIHEFVIGATLVALGTTTPELATTVMARLRRHEDIGIGTLLGSCIFNGLFIVGVAAVIHPIPVQRDEMTGGLVFGLLATLVAIPAAGGMLTRQRGLVLLFLYAAYLGTML